MGWHTKALHPEKGKKFFLLGHFITQLSQSSDSCENAPEHTDVNPIHLMLLFNMNDQENGTISKHSSAWTRYIKA